MDAADRDTAASDAEASALMQRGMDLMADPRPEAAGEALAYFDRALALRQHVSADAPPLAGYALAACWLNRAEALMRMGGAEHLTDALGSFDAAIPLLDALPLDADARFPRRLVIAHQNRGLVLLAQGDVDGAIDALQRALDVLQGEAAQPIEDHALLLGTSLINLASAHAAYLPASLTLVRSMTTRALEAVADLEARDPQAAEVGLNARYLQSHIYAQDIQRQHATGRIAFDDIHHTTDLVDDALALVQEWERHGVTRFRHAAAALFRLGGYVYGHYQPQFLDEFLSGNLYIDRSTADYVHCAEIQAAAADVRSIQPSRVPDE